MQGRHTRHLGIGLGKLGILTLSIYLNFSRIFFFSLCLCLAQSLTFFPPISTT